MQRHGQHRGHDQQGASLVEVLIAIVVLSVVFTATAAITIQASRTATVNEMRTVSSNVLQSESARLRTLPFDELLDQLGQTQRTVDVNGDSYIITFDTEFVSLDVDADPCVADADLADETLVGLRATAESATSPGQSVTTTTTISRPPESMGDDIGTLAVSIRDHQSPSQPVSGALVSLIGPEPSAQTNNQVSPASGCVLFTNLTEGNYEVTVSLDGYVASRPGENETVLRASAGVTAGSRTVVDVRYAPAADLEMSADVTTGQPVAIPEDLPLTLSREQRTKGTVDGATARPLWPGLWEVWAGDCSEADPEALDSDESAFWSGAQRQPRTEATLGSTADGVAVLGHVQIGTTQSDGDPLNGPLTIVAVAQPMGSDEVACENGTDTLTFGTVQPSEEAYDTSGNQVSIGLPFGTWEVTATALNGNSTTGTVVVDAAEPDTVFEVGDANDDD